MRSASRMTVAKSLDQLQPGLELRKTNRLVQIWFNDFQLNFTWRIAERHGELRATELKSRALWLILSCIVSDEVCF